MKLTFKRELPILVLIIVPLIYVLLIWSELPNRVPIHWNIEGEPDNWGSKTTLLLLSFGMPLVTYIAFLLAEKLDPKKRIEKMGTKFLNFRFVLMLLMTTLSAFIIYSSQQTSSFQPKWIMLILGLLFAVLGNYSKTFEPNYFIGIRTPWTLENETVWRATHKLAGKLWFVGGLIICIVTLLPFAKMEVIALVILLTISFIPIIYSYVKWKQLKSTQS